MAEYKKSLYFFNLTANSSLQFMNRNKVKIGVISDTHLIGYDENLKKIIDEHFNDVDFVFHAGDLVNLRVLDIFQGKEVKAVCGNMDSQQVRERLPEYLTLVINGFKFGLIHGWGSPEGIERKILDRLGNVDCMVYGHTHHPVNKIIDNVLFFNPGSAVDKRFASSCTIGILEVDHKITGRIITL